MSGDLVDSVESMLQSRLGDRASAALGTQTVATRAALRAIAPTIVAGLADQGATAEDAEDLLTILRGARVVEPDGSDLLALLAERAPHVGAKAPLVLSQMLFNAQLGDVVDALGSASDMPSRPASHLLEVSIMATFGMLRERVQKEGWNGQALARALQLERMLIKIDLDRRIAKATQFEWLRSDDPGAPLFTPKKSTVAPPLTPPAAPREPAADSEAKAAEPAPGRPRKSMMEMLQARMAQGVAPRQAPAPGAQAPRPSVYAERRLDEWLEEPVTTPAAEAAPPTASPESTPADSTDHAAAAIVVPRQPPPSAPVVAPPAHVEPPAPISAEAPAQTPPPEPEPDQPILDARWPFTTEPVVHAHYVTAPESYAVAQESWAIAPPDAPAATQPTREEHSVPAAPKAAPPDTPQPKRPASEAITPATPAPHRSVPKAPAAVSPVLRTPETKPPTPKAPATSAPTPAARASGTAPVSTIRNEPEAALQLPGPLTVETDMRPPENQRASKPISSLWLLPVVLAAFVLGVFILNYRSTTPPKPTAPPQAEMQVPPSTETPATPPVALEPKPTAPKPVAPEPAPEVKPKPPEPVLTKLKLPNGTVLEVRDNSPVANLLAYLAQPGPAGHRIVLDEIAFERDTSMLAPSADAQLTQLASVLEAYPRLRVRIESHTDRDGDTAVVRALSAERAATVKAGLIMSGIRENRIESQGLGADRPLSTSTSAQERVQNRRTELVVVER